MAVHYQPYLWPKSELNALKDTSRFRAVGTVWPTRQAAIAALREDMLDVDRYDLPLVPILNVCDSSGKVLRVERIERRK